MDSTKALKGKSSCSGIPISIRFNACEESIENITKSSDSLSSCPQQNEEPNWRKEFLQSSFFGRKRSGSIENIQDQGSCVREGSGNTSLSNSNTGKTWKLIKGKVTQAMEDIKSSKSQDSSSKTDDSDAESGPLNSSISDDISDKLLTTSTRNLTDSDSDFDFDADLLIPLDSKTHSVKSVSSNNFSKKSSTSIFKKSLENLKNNCKNNTVSEKSFLRKRKKSPVKAEILNKNHDSTIEIESGVEMLEGMVLGNQNEDEFQDAIEMSNSGFLNDKLRNYIGSYNPTPNVGFDGINLNSKPIVKSNVVKILKILCYFRIIIVGLFVYLFFNFFNATDFTKGVVSCLYSLLILNKCYKLLKTYVEKVIVNSNRKILSKCFDENSGFSSGNGIEKTKFKIPDYSKMGVCEIPAAKEENVLRIYSGWMNVVNSYDPLNFHISLLRPVYIKLNGSALRISNTKNRIPKRSMWNETLVDKKTIEFLRHHYYDILDCEVMMCPSGLARKRYFSRKYPIVLTIKNETSKNSSVDERSISENENFNLNKSETDSDSVTEENIETISETKKIYLFARNDREKEDWFRRFKAASQGFVQDKDILDKNGFFTITDEDILETVKTSLPPIFTSENDEKDQTKTENVEAKKNYETSKENENKRIDTSIHSVVEGLLMTSCASRGQSDYVKFMSQYQKACYKLKSPVIRGKPHISKRKQRREKKSEEDLWKGIDQSLYLGPSGNVVWINVVLGRFLFASLGNTHLLKFLQDFLEKKLTAIKLPSFMEDVHVDKICLGETPPIIHRISQPLLDERGIWIDADITYEGSLHMNISTKLNLMRLRKQDGQFSKKGTSVLLPNDSALSVICDSDAESSGVSSSESGSSTPTLIDHTTQESTVFHNPPGNSRKVLNIVDRITASNLFQSATEISYVQRAMESMSTNIKLHVALKGLVARVTVNIPPPPSDRLWIGFRGPPRLWLAAKPAVGDHTFDWSVVTNVIENKLCDEVYKFLVYPNMVDIIIPFLGQPTYKEKEEPSDD